MSAREDANQEQVQEKPQEVVKQLELKSEVLASGVMGERTAAEEAAQMVVRFRRQLQEAALGVQKKAESQQARIDFLMRTVRAAENEKARLYLKLRNIEAEAESQNEKYELQVESVIFHSTETQNRYKDKIQAALQQLRNLRQFQEHKHQMDEKMRMLGALIAQERKERTAEIAAFHKKLVAQREFYETQLESGLIAADEFSTKFYDLDLDRITTKVLHDTEQRREALKAENALTTEVVKKNDQLRHQIQDLEQQKKVLEESEKNLTAQSVDLKVKLDDATKKAEESIALSKQRLEQLKTHLNNRITDLSTRLEDEKKHQESLKRELVLAQKKLQTAESQRDARLAKDYNMMSVANEAALFILTSLELQEKDPTKEQLTAQSSALNAVIRKIGNLSQDLIGVQPKQTPETPETDTTQPEKTVKKWVPSGRAETAKPTITRALKTPKKTEDFRNNPEYQRIFGKDTGSAAATAAKARVLRITRPNR